MDSDRKCEFQLVHRQKINIETSPEIFSYECDPRRLFSSDQKSVLACGDAKKERIGEELNYVFVTCVLNPIHGQKINETFFFN